MTNEIAVDENRVAYHEAAHVTADLILGHNPHTATIIPRGDTLGSAAQLDGDELFEEGIEALVISLYAGAAAEMQLGLDYELIMLGAGSDYEKADDYLCLLSSTKEDLERKSSELVLKHWPLVERIAQELKEYGVLEWGELDCLLDIYNGKETENDLAEYRLAAVGELDLLRGRRK